MTTSPRTARAAGEAARQPAPTTSPRRCETCGHVTIPHPACECGHLDVFHDLPRGKSVRTKCEVATGPKATRCGCTLFTPATPAQETTND